ncbi:MAG: hypothetical protein HQ557_02815 [Bacteroidetes bacterium]|nr:hypothetical protein [Bacteroidota bacterium]
MKKIIIMVLITLLMFPLFAGGEKEAEETVVEAPVQEEAAEIVVEVAGNYAPNQVETAYGYTHGGYVGKAEVTIDANGLLSVYLDDAFLPHTLAVVDINEPEWDTENTATFISHGEEAYVAKYIEYGESVYVALKTGTGFSYIEADETGAAAGSKDLEKTILRNQVSMAAYYDLVGSGQFKLLTGFEGTAIPITTTTYGGVTKKTAPGYWNTGQTWIGNIEFIESFIAENGLQFSLSQMVRAKEKDDDGLKLWSVADAVSGATNSDFKDYFGLAQNAAGRLK